MLATGRSDTPRAGRRLASGVVQLAVDRPEDESGRLGALPTEFLALVLLERDHEIGEVLVESGGPDEVARGKCRIEPYDGLPGVVDSVALGVHQRPEIGPRSRRRGTGRTHRRRPRVGSRPSDRRPPPTPAAATSGVWRASQSAWRMLIVTSSHHRPSRQIASRARPSVTNPTDR